MRKWFVDVFSVVFLYASVSASSSLIIAKEGRNMYKHNYRQLAVLPNYCVSHWFSFLWLNKEIHGTTQSCKVKSDIPQNTKVFRALVQ